MGNVTSTSININDPNIMTGFEPSSGKQCHTVGDLHIAMTGRKADANLKKRLGSLSDRASNPNMHKENAKAFDSLVRLLYEFVTHQANILHPANPAELMLRMCRLGLELGNQRTSTCVDWSTASKKLDELVQAALPGSAERRAFTAAKAHAFPKEKGKRKKNQHNK
jgi:hypothetical protein